MMTTKNTEGYTQKQLDKLNDEFEKRFSNSEWKNCYRDEAEKWFADEVARR